MQKEEIDCLGILVSALYAFKNNHIDHNICMLLHINLLVSKIKFLKKQLYAILMERI